MLWVPSLIVYETLRIVQSKFKHIKSDLTTDLAMFAIGSFGPMVTYAFEICGAEYRSAINILLCAIPWAVGYSITALLAQLTRDWWLMTLFTGLIIAPFPFLYVFYVPESYRFLISKGKLDQASESFRKFPVKTGCQSTLILHQKLSDETDDNFLESIASIVSVQTVQAKQHKRGNGPMIFTFLVLCVLWMTTSIMFNGLLFFVDRLPGSPFMNTYYTTVLDSLSALITFAVIDR